jgi:hypothetical protein
MKKLLNEENQIHNFISSSGSGYEFLTSYGSGSASQKVTVPTVPVLNLNQNLNLKLRVMNLSRRPSELVQHFRL